MKSLRGTAFRMESRRSMRTSIKAGRGVEVRKGNKLANNQFEDIRHRHLLCNVLEAL